MTRCSRSRGRKGLEGDADALGRAIGHLQALEPAGIGGRNAIEALLLQLDPGDPDYAPMCSLIEDFLDELARNKRPAVARAMGLSLEDLSGLLERLRDLDPRPAAELGSERERPIVPDVIVETGTEGEAEEAGDDAGFRVRVDQSGLPEVSIDPAVEELAREPDSDRELKRYLRGKLDQARWILDAVEQRKATLLRIAQRTFEYQAAFLREGPGNLRALRMSDVAEELELHPSTVSRAVAGKWAETPWGVFPLRHFYQAPSGESPQAGAGASAGASGRSAAAPVARDDVRERVRTIVAAEDPLAPLSDEDIVAALAEGGRRVARRTVAKYRKELGIPSSYRRRKFE